MRKPRDVRIEDLAGIQEAAGLMAAAQRKLRSAGGMKAAAYARCALKSAEGALRHARRCRWVAPDAELRSS